jgi:hypothetical protein
MAPSWQQGVTNLLEKMEQKIDRVDGKLDTFIQTDIAELRERMAKVETRVAIYAGIAGAVGMACGTAVTKLIVK